MVVVVPAVASDAGELLTVSLAAFVTESRALEQADIPPLRDTVADVRAAIERDTVLVARDLDQGLPGRLIGTVRLEDRGGGGYLGRLAVAPDRRGDGIGAALIDAVLTAATGRFDHLDLTTPRRSGRNVALYSRRGWVELPSGPGTDRPLVDDVGIELVWMRRPVPAAEPVARALDPVADADDVARLWAAAVLSRVQRGGLGDESDPVVPAGHGRSLTERPGVFGVLLELVGRPVAVAVAAPGRTQDGAGTDVVPGLAHISAVCVDPVRWGTGAGTTVVTALLDAAAQRGFAWAQLAVDVRNDRARSLYERLGFVLEEGWQGTGSEGALLERWSRSLPVLDGRA
jgi:ribosomal protein S18 acetylase RimI-like enzyme